MSFSALCFAPTAFYWYPFLESVYPDKDLMSVGYKLLMDQLIYTPFLMTWFWFHSTYFSSFVSNWMYWPFVQMINIGAVPDEYKVLVINTASIPWNMYMAYSVAKMKSAATSAAPSESNKSAAKKRKKKPR